MSQQRLRRGNWSVQELERLRLLLPNRGVDQTALLLRRSADSVLRKALDVLRVPLRKGAWTESDDWQLRLAWGAVELRLLAPMLGRPASEVRRRASQLRQRSVQGEWTRTELQLLKKLYGTRCDSDLEVSLMRSRTDITAAAKRLCLAKDKRFQAAQSSSRDVRSGSAWGTGSPASSDNATGNRAGGGNPRRRSSMPRWTAREVEQLRKIYPDQDNLTVARALGRSVTSVANKAYQLGIHKSSALLTSIGRSNIAARYASDDGTDRQNGQDPGSREGPKAVGPARPTSVSSSARAASANRAGGNKPLPDNTLGQQEARGQEPGVDGH